MSMRVPLDPDRPDEVWAELADVGELTSGDVKAVRRVIIVTVAADGSQSYSKGELDDLADEMLVRTVRNWSFPLPLPGEDRTSLDKLPPVAYEELKEAVDGHIALINYRPSGRTSSGSSTG